MLGRDRELLLETVLKASDLKLAHTHIFCYG